MNLEEIVSRNIKRLLEEQDKTQTDLAKFLNVSSTTVNNYVKGYNVPRMDKIDSICKFFGVNRSELLGLHDNKGSQRPIPLIGTIAAGMPILAEQNIEDYFNIDSSVKCDFCLKVQGDSMVDEGIKSGDIVFFKQQADVENGEIGAVIVGTEATLKRIYKRNGSLILQPANAKYEPIILESGDVIIAGKLVAVLNMR